MYDASGTGSANTQWERQTLQKILLEHIVEQRRARRWGIFFKLIIVLFLALIFFIFYSAFTKDLSQPVMAASAHTARIDIKGEIGAEDSASAEHIRKSLKLAYASKQLKGVVLRINSPGGSPVQARQIYDMVRAYRASHPLIKVYAVIEDLGTSAAYLIAAAAESIYADKTSIVGSIGVRIDSFGFVDAIQKLGIERRLYTAGKYKGILDPFLPRNAEEEAFIDEQLKMVHEAFISNVKEGRGNRLKDSPNLFSGLFWTGEQALAMGLIDGYGDASTVAKDIIKAENIVDYSPTTGLLDRLANRVGASMGHIFSQYAGLEPKGVR